MEGRAVCIHGEPVKQHSNDNHIRPDGSGPLPHERLSFSRGVIGSVGASVTWTDATTGLNSSSKLKVTPVVRPVGQLGALIFVPKAGVPVAYSVTEEGDNPPPSIYNFGIVIEQLQ
jgi:hypothetical protein